jgi:hypothetical protein
MPEHRTPPVPSSAATHDAPDAPDSMAMNVSAPSPTGRDLAEVPAVEVISTVAIHLMTAAAVHLGLGEPGEDGGAPPADLDEARKLITALAGLVTSAAPEIGSQHALPLRDGLRTLQLAFREASPLPDPAGAGPGEKLTGPVG